MILGFSLFESRLINMNKDEAKEEIKAKLIDIVTRKLAETQSRGVGRIVKKYEESTGTASSLFRGFLRLFGSYQREQNKQASLTSTIDRIRNFGLQQQGEEDVPNMENGLVIESIRALDLAYKVVDLKIDLKEAQVESIQTDFSIEQLNVEIGHAYARLMQLGLDDPLRSIVEYEKDLLDQCLVALIENKGKVQTSTSPEKLDGTQDFEEEELHHLE